MRVKRGSSLRRRHKRLLNLAEGFRGRRKNCYKIAKRAVQRALKSAFKDRRRKKRDFRALWIVRINAACRQNGVSYSNFIRGMRSTGIQLDRKVLANLAYSDPAAFSEIVRSAASV